MSRVWQYSALKGTERLALVALADCANDEGECFPSLSTVAGALAIEPDIDEARAQIAARLEDLFEQARLAAEVRDSELLKSILIELSLVNDFQRSLED
jgi:hypothetical protein